MHLKENSIFSPKNLFQQSFDLPYQNLLFLCFLALFAVLSYLSTNNIIELAYSKVSAEEGMTLTEWYLKMQLIQEGVLFE